MAWRGTRACAREPQEFTGTIDVVADGVAVAAKPVRVLVPACRHHYPVTSVYGPQRPGDRCLTVEPGDYATLVTIYNPSSCPGVVESGSRRSRSTGTWLPANPRPRRPSRSPRSRSAPGEVTIDDCCALRGAVGTWNPSRHPRPGRGGPLTSRHPPWPYCPPKKGVGDDDDDAHGDGHGDGDHDHDGHGTTRPCCAPSITSRTIDARLAP